MWSLFFSLLISSGAFVPPSEDAHDFHVSRLTANYKPDEQRIECTLMTFIDDLESVLAVHHKLPEMGDSAMDLSHESLNLTEPGEHPLIDSLIHEYLKETLQLKSATSQTPFKITYLGKERDDDPYGMFVYFFIEDATLSPDASKNSTMRLELSSDYMLDLYEDQQNVVVWELNGESSDYDLLTYRTRTCDFEQ